MATDYNIGNFMEKVVFERPTKTASDVGERIDTWETLAERLCEVTDASDSGSEQKEALSAEESFLVKCWDVPGLTTECEAVYNGKRYSIARINRKLRGIVFVDITRLDLCGQ